MADVPSSSRDVAAKLAAAIPAMQARAARLDRDEAFPDEDIALLHSLGLLTAPLPRSLGGQGAGTEPEGCRLLFTILRTVGQGNMAVGRLFEAHVNAVKLIVDYGDAAQVQRMAGHLRAGKMYGVWVTDPPGVGLVLRDGALHGEKGPCSGAGHIPCALVTVETKEGTRMAAVCPDGREQVRPMRGLLHGMRASVNGWVRLDGIRLSLADLIGQPGDYLREPQLSTGAWRTMAVTLGGLDAVAAAVGAQLRTRGHTSSPHQQDRFGTLLIAQETARLWTQAAARCAEDGVQPVADQVAYVNLARIAVEQACLDAMRLAQRSIGFGAFLTTNPLERMLRDLATYLRQPAPDAVLTEAALHGLGVP